MFEILQNHSMKKIISVIVLLISCTFASVGQEIYSRYQLPNNQFDDWYYNSNTPTLPKNWFSFSSADCRVSWEACSTARALGVLDNHNCRVTGHNGNGYACLIYTVHKMDLDINGAMSTGQAVIGSTSFSDEGNYVFTDRHGFNYAEFLGRPDSLTFWARFSFMQNEYPEAMLRIHIHGDVDYHDVASHTSSTPQEGKIANSYCVLPNPATTPNANGIYKSPWTHFGFKFQYWDENNNPIEHPTLENTQAPHYILASFSTNRRANVGANDSLAFDAMYCIYDKGLETLSIDGVENNTIKDFFNQHEYLTHELSTNSGSIVYNYSDLFCYDSLPKIHATAKSSLIRSLTITQPTVDNPKAVIRVIHNDSSYYNYTIHFTNLHPSVSANLNSEDGIYTACEGEDITVTASGADNYVWSNGASGPTIHPTVSDNYTVTASNNYGCTAYNVAYVTVVSLPNVTISGNSSFCAGSSNTLSASGAYSYVWSTGATSNAITVTSSGTYSVTGTSYSGCSNSASFSVTLYPVPNVTISGSNFICSGSEETLTASGASSYLWSNGSTESAITITQSGNYTVTGSNSYGCTAVKNINVQHRDTPSITISGTELLCAGQNGTLTANGPTGTTYTWSNGTSGNTLTVYGSGSYSVTGTYNECRSTASKDVVSVSNPVSPIVTPDSVCGSGEVTLHASSPDNATCYWYLTSTSSTVVATGDYFTTPNLTQNTTYYVNAKNEFDCASERVSVVATVHPLPQYPTLTDTNLCGGGTVVLNDNSHLHWYSDEAGEHEISNIQQVTDSTTFYAAVIDDFQCRSLLRPKRINVNPIPGVPTVTEPAKQCSNSSVSVTLSATHGNNGTGVLWFNSNLVQVSSMPTYTINNLNASTTYYAATTNTTTHCTSDKVPVQIVKNTLPEPPVLSSEARCGAGEVTLSSQPNDLTIKWYNAAEEYLGSGSQYTADITGTTLFKAKAYNPTTTCESNFATVTAVVNPVYDNIIDTKIACGSYTWEGQEFTQSGSYSKTLHSIHGCDSIVTLQLTINDILSTSFDTTVCEQFVWAGNTYTNSQTIVLTFKSQQQCDSIVTCHLTVNHGTTAKDTITLCENQLPYEYADLTITSAGNYLLHLTNVNGCDSSVTLTVRVNPQPALPTVTDKTNCGPKSLALSGTPNLNGNTCRWYATATSTELIQTGTNLTQYFSKDTTFYVSSYNTTTGCESGRIPLHVTIYPIPGVPTVTPDTICGAGTVTLTAEYGENATLCRWYVNTVISDILATGPSYTTYVSASKPYYVESYNANTGCKSTRVSVTATVNALPNNPQTTDLSNCGPLTTDLANQVTGGTLYRWYDSNEQFLQEGTHYQTTLNASTSFLVSNYNSATGCESGKSPLNITIHPTYAPQFYFDTICQYTHYEKYGISQDFNQDGDFNFELNQKSSKGCDSIVKLFVHVNPLPSHEFTVAACEEYVWDGTHYTEGGDFVKTYTSANGCDSTVTLHLTINHANSSTFTEIACDSYTWNGQTYNETGIYVQHLTNKQGCDSAVTMILILSPSQETSFSAEACESYTWNDVTYTESGDYTQHFSTIYQCDSTVTLHLSIYPSYHIELHENICFDSFYVFNGEVLTVPGTYEDTLRTVDNCDSIITLYLNINPEKRDTITAEVCLGNDYNGFDFNIIKPTETQYYSHVNPDVNGCDSTTVLHLFVRQPASTTFNASLCIGGRYAENGFDFTATEAGEFTFTQNLQTTFHCDSIVTLNVTVNPSKQVLLSDAICAGERYQTNGFDTVFRREGNYTLIHNGHTIHGCDSTTTLTIVVYPVRQTHVYDTICYNDSYVFNGETLNLTGIYIDTLASVHQCDSIVTLHLTVYPERRDTVIAHTCHGVDYSGYDFNITNPTATGFHSHQNDDVNGCDSTTVLHLIVHELATTELFDTVCQHTVYTQNGFNFTADEVGTFEHTLSLKTSFQCDSTVTLHLTVRPVHQLTYTAEGCMGEPVSMYGFDTTFQNAGSYTLVHQSQNIFGCDSTTTLNLVIHPTAQSYTNAEICFDSTYDFHGRTLNTSGDYVDTLSTTYGCDSIVTLHLNVRPENRDTLLAYTCYDVAYSGYDFTVLHPTASGYFEHTNQDVNGCDSTTVLYLTVHEPKTTNLESTLCLGEQYNQNGFNILATKVIDTVYTRHLQTTFGCDSAINLHFVVLPVHDIELSANICAGERYNQNGFDTIITLAGTYVLEHADKNIYDCDSMTTLTLTVNPTYHHYISSTICESGSYLFNGEYLTESGFYEATFPTVKGCDSVVSLTLTVAQEYRDTITAHICEGDSYINSGFEVLTPAVGEHFREQHTQSSDHCDSTVVLHLYVHALNTTYLYDTICLGERYRQNGFNLQPTHAGDSVIQRVVRTQYNCDSTIILTLTVNPTYYAEYQKDICVYQNYNEHGFDTTFTQAGEYVLTHHEQTVHGCDSITIVNLEVHPEYHETINAAICYNEVYSFNDTNRTQSGTYTAIHSTVYGCDSIITLNLTVHPEKRDTLVDQICYGESYYDNGFSIQAPEETQYYPLVKKDVNGCDSTTILHLFVNPQKHISYFDTICQYETYQQHGFAYETSEAGDLILTNESQTTLGCDSITTLYLTVLPVHNLFQEAYTCAGEAYTDYGFDTTFSEPGEHLLQHESLNRYGCDSTTTIHLTVYPVYHEEISESICFNRYYNFNGELLNQPGTYIDTLQTVHGCDSIVTLHLDVYAERRDTVEGHICEGDSYFEYGFSIYVPSATTYHHRILEDVNGCDSTIVLHLYVHPNKDTTFVETLCLGEHYVDHGFDIQPSFIGEFTYTQHKRTSFGCDSMVYLQVTVNPTSQITLFDTICSSNEPYQQHGFDTLITNAGQHVLIHHDENVVHCDSTTTLYLTVWPSYDLTIYKMICENSSYDFNGQIITEAGTYEARLNTSKGCDSIVTLIVTVGAEYRDTIVGHICAGESYHQNGFDIDTPTESGYFDILLQAKNGCDSVVVLALTVFDTNSSEFDTTACDSFTWNETVYTESGDHVQTLSNIHGCDSIVTMHLTILNSIHTTLDTVVCDSLEWNGIVYTVNDVYEQTFPSHAGCDSIVTINLTVNHSTAHAFSETACDTYTWNETTYTASGEYTQVFRNAAGCDSVVTLNLTIGQTTFDEETATACDTFAWHGRIFTEDGDYYDTIPNAAGCDSIVTLHLTLNHSDHIIRPLSVCDSLVWDNEIFRESGEYTKTFSNHDGCDSIVTLILTVNQTFVTDTTVDICDVATPFEWGIYSFDSTDVYNLTYETASGCDSIIRLHLNVHPTIIQDTVVTVCQGALPYEFCTDHSYTASGVDTVRLQTVSGCDSIWILDLQVIPNVEHTESLTICESELPYIIDNDTLTGEGTFDIIETDGDYCLTITHLTLNVNPTFQGNDEMTVCQEALPVFYGNDTLTEQGTFYIHFSTVNHCDSVVVLTLNVIPTAQGIDTMYVCTHDFPTIYHGQTFDSAGVYSVTLTREGLCDSIVTLNLIEAEEYTISTTDEVCDFELPYQWRGRLYSQNGVYYDSLSTIHGCDSIFVLNLTVNNTQVIVSDPIMSCEGDTVEWRGMFLFETDVYHDTVPDETTGCRIIYEVNATFHQTYLFHDTVTICSDELPHTWRGFIFNGAGTREVSMQTVETSCDSIYRHTVFVNPSYHAAPENITVCNYDLPYYWHDKTLTESGTYYDTLTTISGCDSTFMLILTVNPSLQEITTDTICDVELPYIWRNHNIMAAGHYLDTIPNTASGCNDVFELMLTVLESNETTLYDTACEGSHYTLHGFDTIAAQSGTMYLQRIIANSFGCDSTVNLVLTVLSNEVNEEFGVTCENIPFEWRGYILDTTGVYYDNIVTPTGCDSVFVLHLTVNPAYDIYVSDTATREHTYTYGSFVITPADSGVFSYDIQHYTIAGCDSVIHLTLYVEYNTGIEDPVMMPEFKFFPNPTNAVLNINGEQMKQVLVYDLNGKLVRKSDTDSPENAQIDVTGFASGHYIVKVLLDNGQSVTRKIIVDRR